MGSHYLYHGSAFDTGDKPLCPGFVHSGELVEWDGGFENNKYLYATDSVNEAILLGLGSLTEKKLGTQGFRYVEGSKEIYFIYNKEDLITEKDLEKKIKDAVVYLYTIKIKPSHGWLENNNPKNNIDEWKTNRSIPRSDYVRSTIEILKWLKDNQYVINTVAK